MCFSRRQLSLRLSSRIRAVAVRDLLHAQIEESRFLTPFKKRTEFGRQQFLNHPAKPPHRKDRTTPCQSPSKSHSSPFTEGRPNRHRRTTVAEALNDLTAKFPPSPARPRRPGPDPPVPKRVSKRRRHSASSRRILPLKDGDPRPPRPSIAAASFISRSEVSRCPAARSLISAILTTMDLSSVVPPLINSEVLSGSRIVGGARNL